MTALELARQMGHEEVILLQVAAAGLRAVIAIHDTSLGPAVGGTRMRIYPTLDDAMVDALRLARAMTYKAALAEIPRGGGKAVIVGDPARDKTPDLLTAYARAVDRLGGRFHSGADMGIDARDVAVMSRVTRYVSHTPSDAKVDTAELAALGVLASIRAAAAERQRTLDGLHVAVQGLGEVGYRLARMLRQAGARLTVADVDAGRAERAAAELEASIVAPDAVYDVEADVFSPNAAGGIINDATLPRLRCRAVAGAANEQLAEPRHGDALHERGILYGPDYVVNAGGLLSLLFELGETDEEGVRRQVEAIGGRLAEMWARARREGVAPHRLADRIAEERVAAARRRR
jgi:glutamate dehydrogenase/leucine dehydrogenase